MKFSQQEFDGEDWKIYEALGANRQRPLMASTGVKDPALPDTLYVTELVAPMVVNTMPEKTMEAVFDHGVITSDSITENYDSARAVLAELESVGISYNAVVNLLEKEGVEKFVVSWNELVETVSTALKTSQ
jgi:transaldolase